MPHEEFHGARNILEDINNGFNLVVGATWPKNVSDNGQVQLFYNRVVTRLISGMFLNESEIFADEAYGGFITFHHFFKNLKKENLTSSIKEEIKTNLLRILFYLRTSLRVNTYAYHYLRPGRQLAGGFFYPAHRKPKFRVLIPHTFNAEDPALNIQDTYSVATSMIDPQDMMVDLKDKTVTFWLSYQLPSKVLGVDLPETGNPTAIQTIDGKEYTALESFLRRQNYYFYKLYVAFKDAVDKSFIKGKLNDDLSELEKFADQLKDFDPDTFTVDENILGSWIPKSEQEIDEFTKKTELEYL